MPEKYSLEFFDKTDDYDNISILIGHLNIIVPSAQRWQQMRHLERPGNIELHSVVMMCDIMERVGDSWFSAL